MRTGVLGGRGAAIAAAMMTVGGGLPAIEIVRQQQKKQQAAKPAQRVEVRAVYRKSNKLNRSRHWPFAESYADARAMSPFPNRPVR